MHYLDEMPEPDQCQDVSTMTPILDFLRAQEGLRALPFEAFLFSGTQGVNNDRFVFILLLDLESKMLRMNFAVAANDVGTRHGLNAKFSGEFLVRIVIDLEIRREFFEKSPR